MFRIDSSGATIDNRFTEGDPSLSVPATVVSADWLNHVQEEVSKTIEEMGITLSKASENQHYAALLEMSLRGGRKLSYNADLANNTGPADIEDNNDGDALLIADKSLIKNKIFIFDIERKTDTQIVKEYGLMFLGYNSKDDDFEDPKIISLNGDAGTTFTLAQIGATDEYKLQYTTDDLTGTSYVGVVDITSIIEIRQ